MGGFMIQGGDPDSRNSPSGQQLGAGGPGYTIPAEFTGGLHVKGALSAARLSDAANPAKESSGSQFYIVQGTQIDDKSVEAAVRRNRTKSYTPKIVKHISMLALARLSWTMNITVFGQVVEGLDVIDKIAQQQVDGMNRPVEDVRMKVLW